MMSLAQLRKKYKPASPQEVLQSLADLSHHPQVPEDYAPPLLTVILRSGHTFRAYLVGATDKKQGEQTFLFSLEIEHSGDAAADLCYVSGAQIEAVTVWNVDDYPGTLPRFPKSQPV